MAGGRAPLLGLPFQLSSAQVLIGVGIRNSPSMRRSRSLYKSSTASLARCVGRAAARTKLTKPRYTTGGADQNPSPEAEQTQGRAGSTPDGHPKRQVIPYNRLHHCQSSREHFQARVPEALAPLEIDPYFLLVLLCKKNSGATEKLLLG